MSTSSVRVGDAWMTAELLQLLQDEGMADNGGSLSARTKRTTCTRASKPDKLRQGDEDVLVDALAEFMRPASQSTIRTRHTKGSGVHSPKEHAKSHGEGLMQKQLLALERIGESLEATGGMSGGTRDIIHDAQSKRHRSTSALGAGLAVRTPLGGGGVRATSVVLSLPNEGISGARGASFGDDMLDGVRQGSFSKMPAVKSIRPFVNMTSEALRRRKQVEDVMEEKGRPMHPILISRRFNRAKDNIDRTLRVTNDAAMLRRFRSGNHAVPARELGVGSNL